MRRFSIRSLQKNFYQSSRIALIAMIALACLAACKRVSPLSEQEAATARCMKDLSSIPQMAALLKFRNRGAEGETERSLEGMEIALTINGMIQSKGDPDRGIDSWCSKENTPENFEKLLGALKQNDMPPTVSFVIGRLLDQSMAEAWLESGNPVGNMTYKPMKPRKKAAQKFIDDVNRSEELLAPLWKKFPSERKYFRYPGMKVSRDTESREQIEAYLKEKGYVEVPVTINAQDAHFTDVYCASMDRGDQPCLNLIKNYYKAFLLEITYKARLAARKVAGREIKHILAIKANQFTADNLTEILTWYKNLGVKFIPIDEALSDPFYAIMDDKGKPAYRSIIKKIKRGKFVEKQGE